MSAMSHGARRILSVTVPAALVMQLAACDTSVTNPGPTPDEFLNLPESQGAVLLGARNRLSNALGGDDGKTVYWGGALTFEINPAGSTGSFGLPGEIQLGLMTNDNEDGSGDAWGDVQTARFAAEDGYDRFTDPARAGAGASTGIRAELALLAGYANRLAGETFCQAVLPPQESGKTYPAQLTTGSLEETSGTLSDNHLPYLTRAEEWFRIAIDLGSGDIETAANAGLASVLATLATYGQGDWGAAASAAALVSDDFVFQATHSDQDQDQFNAIHWANANAPYRAHTQWGTFAEFNGFCRNCTEPALLNDPRMPWDSTDMTGDASVAKFGGNVTWYPQAKYDDATDGVNLSSGWEMRLIEAEAALVGGGAGAAVDLMNMRRADLGGLALYDNTVSADSAWTLLKLERQFELWLEARRLADLRRWNENGVSGFEADGLYTTDSNGDGINDTRVETMFNPVERGAPVGDPAAGSRLCWPIGKSERETNPNISLEP
jgi:hypothetical protein